MTPPPLSKRPLAATLLISAIVVVLALLYLSRYRPTEFIYMQF